MNARKTQIRLSYGDGVVHPRGWRRPLPAERMSDRPAPTWMPFTTGVGMA